MKTRTIDRRVVLAGLACGALASVAGCGSLIPVRIPDASEASRGADAILLVGRIEVTPPIGPGEQKFRLGSFDPFDVKGILHQRALVFLGDAMPAGREQSGHYLNPRLGEWFAYWVPRERRHITDAHIVMESQTEITGRRQTRTRTSEILLPAPLAIDVRAGDSAIYLGSWRVWRDEFNSVVRVEVKQDVREAETAAKRLIGKDMPLRLAVPRGLAR